MRNESTTRSYRSKDSISSLSSIYHTAASCNHNCWITTRHLMWRGEVKASLMLKPFVLRVSTGTANTASSPSHSLSRDRWALQRNGKPNFLLTIMWSVKTDQCFLFLESTALETRARTQHIEVWVSQESRVCLSLLLFHRGGTYLFLGNAVIFKHLAMTYKGRWGKRQTVPVNIINNINQQAICLIIKWAQNTNFKYVEVCVCLCMCIFVSLQYSTSTKT